MPNWCDNSITIHNPKKFKEVCIKNGQFSFNNFIPMPKHMEVYNNVMGSNSTMWEMEKAEVTKENLGGELNNFYFKGGIIDCLYVKEWVDAEEKRTGIKADSWYDWNCKNWGTKWDVDRDVVDMVYLEKAISDNKPYYLAFDTAWTPPIEAFEKMAALGVEFEFVSQESGCGIYCEGKTNGKNELCFSFDEDHDWDNEE